MVPACKTEPPPQDIPAMIVRALADGDSLLRNNKVDEAAKEYAWVVEQDASNAAALTGLGRVELARENPAGAIDPLKKAVAAKAAAFQSRAHGSKVGRLSGPRERLPTRPKKTCRANQMAR